MSRPDPIASAALDARVIRPVFFAYLDILGDPLRANTSGRSWTFPAIGLEDIDGQTFDGIDPSVVDIGPVRMKEGGSEPVRAKLSGLVGLDEDLLNITGNDLNWKGRTARLWRMIRNAAGTPQGLLQHYYTGYMTSLKISGDPSNQVIDLTIESYLASHSKASNRTYLDQTDFDPGDLSASAAIGIVNGVSNNPLLSSTPIGGGGGGGGGGYYEQRMFAQ